MTIETVTAEILTAVCSEENIRKAVHEVMVKHGVVTDETVGEESEITSKTFIIPPQRWMSMVNCVK